MKGTFRSLGSHNYRVWSAGALVSNVGTWMQRVAQDWLVLTELTQHSAAAMGWVMALQFGPQLLLMPLTGLAANRLDRRRLLFATQAGRVRLWHVDVFAFLLGCVSAFDGPARQVFVADMVGEADLSNAVALNSTSFNAARMVGPAAAALFGGGCALASGMPTAGFFGAALVPLGAAVQTFTTSTNSLVQVSTEPALRGRVMAIVMALILGAASGLVAALVGIAYLVRHRSLRLRQAWRLRVNIDGQETVEVGVGTMGH